MTDADIRELVSRGESVSVEFKTRITESRILSRNISAFANGEGGKVLVGVDERHRIVGCDREQLRRMFEAAQREIDGEVHLALDFVDIDQKTVGVISVGRAKGIVSSLDGIFSRFGAAERAMSSIEIQKRISSEEDSTEKLTRLVSEQTKRIEELHEELRRSNSLKSKTLDYLIGGLVGAVIGFVLTLAFT